VLDRLLHGVRGGRGGVLVADGEAGVGKTALLEYAVEAACEFRIARTSGVEGEMELPLAAVQQLCSPFLDFWTVFRSRSTRRLALRSDSPRGLRRIRSCLDWRSSACCPRRPRSDRCWPLSMTHIGSTTHPRGRSHSWLAASWRRRSRSCSPAREPGDVLAGLPELHVLSLGHRDARTLLESALPARLDERVLDRIVAETRGNPLALLELPRGLSPTQLAGGLVCRRRCPLSASIEESFTRPAGQSSR